MFHWQIPAIETFLFRSLGMTARFSVSQIEPQSDGESATVYGSVWAHESITLLGRYEALFTFKELSSTPTSFTYKVRIEPASIKRILASPAQFPGFSFYPGAYDKPYTQSLGLELQSAAREMNGKGERRIDIWGTETLLAFDTEGRLALEIRSPLPNPYVSLPTQPSYEHFVQFHREYVPRLNVMFGKMFKGNLKIEQVLSSGGHRFLLRGPPEARFLLIAASGNVYGGSVHLAGGKLEISVFSTGEEKTADDRFNEDLSQDTFHLSNTKYSSRRLTLDLKDLPQTKQL